MVIQLLTFFPIEERSSYCTIQSLLCGTVRAARNLHVANHVPSSAAKIRIGFY